MRDAGVLCVVALLVSVAEPRPNAFESVTTVISRENAEVPSSEYAEVATSTEFTEVATSTGFTEVATSTGFTEVAISTEYPETATSTQHTEVTSVDYAAETTEYSEEATSTQHGYEATASTQHADVVTSVQYAEMTTEEKLDVTTKDFGVENLKLETTTDVPSDTEDSKGVNSTSNVENKSKIVKDSLEITTEISDKSAKNDVNLRIISTRNAEVTEAVTARDEVETDSSTIFDVAASTIPNSGHVTLPTDVEETTTNIYAEGETTTGYDDVLGSFGNIEGRSAEGPIQPLEDTDDVIRDNLGLVHPKKHDPEPYINSSLILPCFAVNARRGITPFIARSYDFETELESWTKKKLPTEIAFLNSDNSLHFVDLSERPQGSQVGLKVKEYGDTVSLYLYTRHRIGTGVKLSLDVRHILRAGFNPLHPTKVIAHGFWSNKNSSSVQLIKDAYLGFGYYNVIIVDWSPLVYGFYSSAREEAHGVGDYLGQFLRFLVYEGLTEPEKLHLIGHSLGAHLVGFAGKRAHQDGWGIMRITGLDPALPYFTMSDHTERLDRSDADVVDVIHTCANFLGMTSYLGHIDFYPNEGTNYQPGCNLDVFGICSHGRAVDYFAESISEPSGFVGKFCDFERADSIVKADNCPGEPIAVMGEWLEFSQPGRYVLRTASRPPYGVGLDILYPAYLYKRTRAAQ